MIESIEAKDYKSKIWSRRLNDILLAFKKRKYKSKLNLTIFCIEKILNKSHEVFTSKSKYKLFIKCSIISDELLKFWSLSKSKFWYFFKVELCFRLEFNKILIISFCNLSFVLNDCSPFLSKQSAFSCWSSIEWPKIDRTSALCKKVSCPSGPNWKNPIFSILKLTIIYNSIQFQLFCSKPTSFKLKNVELERIQTPLQYLLCGQILIL